MTFQSNGQVFVQSCMKSGGKPIGDVQPTCGASTPLNIPNNGAIYTGQPVIVSGVVNGRVTIGSASDIYIGGNLSYAQDGDDVLGLVASHSVIVAQWVPTVLELAGRDDRAERDLAVVRIRSADRLVRARLRRQLQAHVGDVHGLDRTYGGGSMGLFNTRVYQYDSTLVYLPPPWFPTIQDAYTVVLSREVAATPNTGNQVPVLRRVIQPSTSRPLIGPQRASERRETPRSNRSLRSSDDSLASGRQISSTTRHGSPSAACSRCSSQSRRRAARMNASSRSDDVHLGVVEERVLVEVRRADGHPGVVDDSDLRVDVHGVPAGLKERAREKALLAAALLRRVDEHAELPARVVLAVVRIRRQHDDDPEVRMRWIASLLGEDLRSAPATRGTGSRGRRTARRRATPARSSRGS